MCKQQDSSRPGMSRHPVVRCSAAAANFSVTSRIGPSACQDIPGKGRRIDLGTFPPRVQQRTPRVLYCSLPCSRYSSFSYPLLSSTLRSTTPPSKIDWNLAQDSLDCLVASSRPLAGRKMFNFENWGQFTLLYHEPSTYQQVIDFEWEMTFALGPKWFF